MEGTDAPFLYIEPRGGLNAWFREGSPGYKAQYESVIAQYRNQFTDKERFDFATTGKMATWDKIQNASLPAVNQTIPPAPATDPDGAGPGGPGSPTDPTDPGTTGRGEGNIPGSDVAAFGVTRSVGRFQSSRPDYAGFRIPLTLSTSVFQTFKKEILLTMAIVVFGAMVFKFSEEKDPDVQEFFRLQKAKRKMMNKKAEALKAKRDAQAVRDRAPKSIQEADAKDRAADQSIKDAQDIDKVIERREKNLLKGRDRKKMSPKQLLKDIEERQAVARVTKDESTQPLQIGELSVGEGISWYWKGSCRSNWWCC